MRSAARTVEKRCDTFAAVRSGSSGCERGRGSLRTRRAARGLEQDPDSIALNVPTMNRIALGGSRRTILVALFASLAFGAWSVDVPAGATPCVDEPCQILGPGGVVDPNDLPDDGFDPVAQVFLTLADANHYNAVASVAR